jgi:hypothetical protein
MTEATQPLPAMTSHAVLVAMMEQTVAELRANREMLERAIAQQGPSTEMVMLATRLAEFEDTIRKAVRKELALSVLQPPDAAPDVPRPRRPRSGSHRQRAPGEGQMKLFRVPALAAAFAAVTPHLRHARHLAHVHRLAAALTASVSATALAGTAAIIILPGGVSHSPSGAQPAFSAPAATAAGSVIGPSSSPVAALAARHRGGKADSRASRVLQSAVTGAAPAQSGVSPQPQPPSSSSPPSASPGGPAVLSVSTTAIDLDSASSTATITLSATGAPGSWVKWDVSTFDPATGIYQGDLDFSATHGILVAGQSATVTVTVDPAQAEDGDASETFGVAGQSVTASLPALAPAVEPSGTPTPLPSVVPSVIASVEASLTG